MKIKATDRVITKGGENIFHYVFRGFKARKMKQIKTLDLVKP